jgi:hypothetical protein
MERNQTSKEYLRSTQIVHLAMLLGQVFFAGVSLFVVYMNGASLTDANTVNIFLIVEILIASTSTYASRFLFAQKLKTIEFNVSLSEKLGIYNSANIIRWALLEGPSFMSIILYFLTGQILFMIISLAIMSYFVMIRPTLEKTINDLQLNEQEKLILSDPNAII